MFRKTQVFFRKNKFGTNLNIGAKKIVNQFEEFKISLSAIAKLSELNIERTIPIYNVQQEPQKVANDLRKKLYPDFDPIPKEFLRALIGKLAEMLLLKGVFIYQNSGYRYQKN